MIIRSVANPDRRAFTLVEVMFGLALVIALLGGLTGLSLRVMERRAQTREWSRAQEIAERIIGTLDRDLGTCTIGDGLIGSGVSGDASSIRIISRGVLESPGDLVVTELRFDPASGVVRARRSGLDTVAPESAEEASAAGIAAPPRAELSELGRGIAGIRLLYRDKDQWVERFDSLAGSALPLAVQIEIWFGPTTSAGGGSSSPTEDGAGQAATGAAPDVPMRAPDRVRVIAIPDAGGQMTGVSS